MIRIQSLPTSLRLALVAAGLGAIFAGWSVAGAVRVAPVQAKAGDSTKVVVPAEKLPGGRVARITESVDHDPFSPTRTRPAQRYRLPGEVDDVPTRAPQRSQLRFVGVIGDGTTKYLYLALGNLPAQKLVIGDKIGEYTLKQFDGRSATLATPAGDLLVVSRQTLPGR